LGIINKLVPSLKIIFGE